MHNTRLENPGATSYAAGGHTAEMVALLKAMDHTRYTPRTYIVAETDRWRLHLPDNAARHLGHARRRPSLHSAISSDVQVCLFVSPSAAGAHPRRRVLKRCLHRLPRRRAALLALRTGPRTGW